jgi:hypothetical protein
VSWNGFSFPPDERGINWLPVEAINEMTESHGMIGVPGAVACDPAPDPRDALILQLQARIAELEAPDPGPAKAVQGTDGGGTRTDAFPPGGEHPEGGPQPALMPAAAAEAPTLEKPVAGSKGKAA